MILNLPIACESLTIDNCERELIHIPGHIQSHGALLVFDEQCLLIGWSANAGDLFESELKLGSPVASLANPVEIVAHVSKCCDAMIEGKTPTSVLAINIGERHFDCLVHAYQSRVLVEFELSVHSSEDESSVALTGQSAIDCFMHQKNVVNLLQTAVDRVREITGFDRVMAYRFRDDASGEVVAESCFPHLNPYLGQRYPASDIPPQARRLYILNTLRTIANVDSIPVPVLTSQLDTPIDMSHCVLRSVSPIHIEYLKNMGVSSSMSISIVINGQLWGMLACHHSSAKYVSNAIRKACDLLTHVLTAKVQNLEAALHSKTVEEATMVRFAVFKTLQSEADMLQGLIQHAPELKHSFGAHAIVIAQYGEVRCYGDVSPEIAEAILESLPKKHEEVLQRTSFEDWPEKSQPLLGKWVGLLGICFDWINSGWILALRVEQIETVRWGGKPTKNVSDGPMGHRLTPRVSFDEWKETIKGRCEPWDPIGISSAGQLLAKIHSLNAVDLLRRATHDLLTGLPNRALLLNQVSRALKRSIQLQTDVALMFIDLDGFKQVNDIHGHNAGDFLLDAVAQRLLGAVRGTDTVARIAGDEFVVLCSQVTDPADLTSLAERINVALREPFSRDEVELYVSASIGIAIGRGATHSSEDLLRCADAAMYSVKHSGRDGWQFFNREMHSQAQQRIRIANGLRYALERQEFSIRYQPIVIAESGRIVGAELLLRWNPQEGEISPAVFIPVAEMTRVIAPIGLWVFSQACIAEVAWRKRWGSKAPYLSVNVSPRQLDEVTLMDDFAEMLRTSGADPSRIVLEITETALMANVEANLKVLHGLASLGLRLAVDDFGTGYSSLAQLTRMPVHILKIDRAFVDSVDSLPENRMVVRAVIALGHALGLALIAEGVETAAQQLELCSFGCDFIQGYHFHRPMLETALIASVDYEILEGSAGAVAPLHFLIYVSEAVTPMSTEEISFLISQSRVFNQSVAVTGCLAYQDGCFMQMIEGPREALLTLFHKIEKDPRHRKVRLVIEAKAPRRMYADWTMVLRDLKSTANLPDFTHWQNRSIGFMELAEDARICYAFITCHTSSYG